ncbi:MAG: endo-1,4-beta-xylanase [Bacteroidales bacterium]|nr:endo-1,4-beta-xylanase [Bacteroidales bacterium]MBR0037160.1 endo-1,4-beta-xylanase [Bacteroidales bacterium]
MKMNNICGIFMATFAFYAISFAFTSCADSDMEQFKMKEPESLQSRDYLNNYDKLCTYDPQVGIVMDATVFLDRGMEYRIGVANFGQLVPGLSFCHGQVIKANGAVDTTTLSSVIKLAAQHHMTLVGTPLLSHENQNAAYLNALLSPNVIRPEGDDGGYCLKMTNSTSTAQNNAQVAYTFARTPQVEPGIKYKLTMMVRGTTEGTIQVSTYSNGRGSRFSPNVSVTTEWKKVELQNTMASGIKGLTSILFSMGTYVGTLFVDDIELFEVDNRGNEVTDNLNTLNTNLDDKELTVASIAIQTNTNASIEEAGISVLGEGYDPLASFVEKTDEEKRQLLNAELERYLSGVIGIGEKYVKEWVVISDPLAEDSGNASEFFWQKYLGNDYALTAFQLAKRMTDGKLYIGAGILNTTQEAENLIEYVNHIDNLGAVIDGIALTLHTSISSTTNYEPVFQVLANSGKLIKLMDVRIDIDDIVNSEVTEEQLHEQAAMLTKILNAYNTYVPQAQQTGIVWHQMLDNDEPLGLWNTDYNRKYVYGSLADGIK